VAFFRTLICSPLKFRHVAPHVAATLTVDGWVVISFGTATGHGGVIVLPYCVGHGGD